MIVSWLTLQCLVISVFANPVAFPGDFNLAQKLSSTTVSLPEESLVSCDSLHAPDMTTTSLTATSRIMTKDLNVDVLIGTGGTLEFAGLVQVAGSVSEETVPSPAAPTVPSPSTTTAAPSSAFLQQGAPPEQLLHFSSFLSPHGNSYLNDLEAQLNKVGHNVYSSFLVMPRWTLFGVVSEEAFTLSQLPPHHKILLKATVTFTSPEWNGAALTLFVDGTPLWQETHSWIQPSCEVTNRTQTADVLVSTPHAKKSLVVEFRSSLTNECGLQSTWELPSVLVYYR